MPHSNDDLKARLLKKGVRLPAPESVEIGPEVKAERIAGEGVTIHAGSKIFGPETWIGAGSQIGLEAPATIDNCQIGQKVSLKGGYFSQAVFLNGASCGSCAHVRKGTILEEEASIAHSVGLKQTILFPHVTLGSLINFCDCLMAGGTDAKNHSEVGSSYIHFNFTPQQDKATASLIGDVPGGVMLDKPPVFLGGQGGLVGPCRLAYGVTIAAGTIYRKDELRPNRLIFGGAPKTGNIAWSPSGYRNVGRIVLNNLIYIGNLLALGQWYRHIRCLFISETYPRPLHEGLIARLNQAVAERIQRMAELIDKISETENRSGRPDSRNLPPKQEKRSNLLLQRQSEILAVLNAYQDTDILHLPDKEKPRDQLQETVNREIHRSGRSYLEVVKQLPAPVKTGGTDWLQAVVDHPVHAVLRIIPEFAEEKGS